MSKVHFCLKKIIKVEDLLDNKKYINNRAIEPGSILRFEYLETPKLKFFLEKKRAKNKKVKFFMFMRNLFIKKQLGICICKRNRFTDGYLIARKTIENNPVDFFYNYRSHHILQILKAKEYYVNFNKARRSQMLWLRNRKAKKSRIHFI